MRTEGAFAGRAVVLAVGLCLITGPSHGDVRRGAAATDDDASRSKLRASVDDSAIRPFRANVPQAAVDELRRRIVATRWPDRETVTDGTQGVPLAKLEEL